MIDYREAFGLFDRVGDNKVCYNQIADIMRALGQNPTNKEVKAILGNPSDEGRRHQGRKGVLVTYCILAYFAPLQHFNVNTKF